MVVKPTICKYLLFNNDMNEKIRVSIITVCFNCVDDIEETLISVVSYLQSGVEYIVVDGGSTDGTLDVINKYRSNISVFISEKDEGIYDAMNKGMDKAKGQWCIFINAGDRLMSIPQILLDDQLDSYSAVFCSVSAEKGRVICPYYNWRIRYKNTIPHQGAFYNIGIENFHYDIHYKVFADYDLNLRMYLAKRIIRLLPSEVVAFHSCDGISNNKRYSRESYNIVRKHSGLIFLFLSFIHKKKMGLEIRYRNVRQKLMSRIIV